MRHAAAGKKRHGFAGMPAVTILALILTLSLMVLFRVNSVHQDQAAKAQLRTDYQQREEAVLRAVVAAFPRRVIDCMRADYAPSAAYSWDTIFAESVAMASAAVSLSPSLLATLGLDGARSADVGDASAVAVTGWISDLEGEQGRVTPGTTDYAAVFLDQRFAGKVPPLLNMSAARQIADAVRPVVSIDKHYLTQQEGLLADVTKYPTYNRIPYPNIRFGFSAAGQPFVAKRNWWAFTVTYGATVPGVPLVSKHYVLSLYEIPTQLPIEGAALAQVGTHQSASPWNASSISIDGGVYANQVSMSDSFGATRISAKQSITMASSMTLDGSSPVGSDFDAPGVREQLQIDRMSDLLPVALSTNSGRLTFVPIQRGGNFLQSADASNAWETYSRGAEKCRIIVDAIDMVHKKDQTPTEIRIRFRDGADATVERILERGTNWPTLLEPGGNVIPFQTELTSTNRSCLTFHPSLLEAWLLLQGGASVTSNNSICIRTDATVNPVKVRPTSDPPTDEDMCVILRKGKNLTAFSEGLSIVTPHRVYVGDDLNDVEIAAPPEGWLAPDSPPAEYFPPLSISSAELRIGTTGFIRPFEHHGQVTTLSSGGGGAWHPLDIRSGSDDAVHEDSIAATLTALSSPAELPPVHQMNWLVTIEEIPQD